MAATDALKRIPAVYWAVRRARMAVGDLLPPRSVTGVPGPVHRNDVMFATGTGPEEYARTGAQASRFVADAVAASGLRPARGVDLGSGHGRVLRHLLRDVPIAWTACDIDASAVRFCSRAFQAAPVQAATPLSATRFPYPPYEVTWMGSLVTHLPDAAERDLWALLARIGGERSLVALSFLPPAMVGNLGSFGPGMAAAAPQVAARLAADGRAYLPYPHHPLGDYGVAFHDPARLVSRVADATGRTVQVVSHAPGAWEGMQDYLALLLIRR